MKSLPDLHPFSQGKISHEQDLHLLRYVSLGSVKSLYQHSRAAFLNFVHSKWIFVGFPNPLHHHGARNSSSVPIFVPISPAGFFSGKSQKTSKLGCKFSTLMNVFSFQITPSCDMGLWMNTKRTPPNNANPPGDRALLGDY